MDAKSRELLDQIREVSAEDVVGIEAVPLSFTNYSLERTLRRAHGYLYGNWNSSFAGACSITFENYLPEGAVVSLRRVGTCPNGGECQKFCV